MRARPIAGLLVVVAACSTSSLTTPEVVDTSGARFAWVCKAATCLPEIMEGTPPLPPCNVGTPLYAWAFNRFIVIDAACTSPSGGWGSTANRSRPLACEDAGDCPQFTTGSFECRNGLCQNEDTQRFPIEPLTWSDAFSLCYGPIARQETIDPLSPASREVNDAVAQACPTSGACTQPLPLSCIQP
jgi:hypothetical protein